MPHEDKLKVRIATPKDIPDLHKLINDAFHGSSGKRGWTDSADFISGPRITEDELHKMFVMPDTIIIVYCWRDKLIACLSLQRQGDYAVVGLMAVLPEYQKYGIGKKSLEFAENFAKVNWQVDKIKMRALEPRVELIAWHMRRGYCPTGEKISFAHNEKKLGNSNLAFVVLEKKLPRCKL